MRNEAVAAVKAVIAAIGRFICAGKISTRWLSSKLRSSPLLSRAAASVR